MSVLTDTDIADAVAMGWIGIEPYTNECVQPASYDLHLSEQFRTFTYDHAFIDPKLRQENLTMLNEMEDEFWLLPGQFILGSTIECVTLPDDLVGRIEGKSSLGRLGLICHATAGFVDPGWKGTLTLEMSSFARVPIILTPGMPIAQIAFMEATRSAARPYGRERGSKYVDSSGPQDSRYYQNFMVPTETS